MVNHNLKYFCLECGSELFCKMSINEVESLSNSQERLMWLYITFWYN